jgi:hypothetical protein
MTMIQRIAFGVLCGFAFGIISASADDKPVRVRGTIEAVDGQMLAVKGRDGSDLKIKMTDGIKVIALVESSLTDIKPGSFVGATAMPEQDGSWKAVEVHIFPESMRGTGEGDRPYDYHPKSTMTNGTVNASVSNVSGSSMTLKYKEGEKKIDIPSGAMIVTYVPGSKDELKPGAKIYIPAATRQADGSLMTPRINVGRGKAQPL